MLRIGHLMAANMIKFSSLIAVCISILLVACAGIYDKSSTTESIDYGKNIGWLHGNCLAIKNVNLAKDTKMRIVQLDEPQTIFNATVLNKADDGEKCFPLSEDRRKINISTGYTFYLINSELEINLGVAVIGSEINNKEHTFNYCSTSEGILFSLKQANKNDAEDLWSGYYYLGYDTKATCVTGSNN